MSLESKVHALFWLALKLTVSTWTWSSLIYFVHIWITSFILTLCIFLSEIMKKKKNFKRQKPVQLVFIPFGFQSCLLRWVSVRTNVILNTNLPFNSRCPDETSSFHQQEAIYLKLNLFSFFFFPPLCKSLIRSICMHLSFSLFPFIRL